MWREPWDDPHSTPSITIWERPRESCPAESSCSIFRSKIKDHYYLLFWGSLLCYNRQVEHPSISDRVRCIGPRRETWTEGNRRKQKIRHHHVHNILVASQVSPIHVGRDYKRVWMPGGENHLGCFWKLATTAYSQNAPYWKMYCENTKAWCHTNPARNRSSIKPVPCPSPLSWTIWLQRSWLLRPRHSLSSDPQPHCCFQWSTIT